MRRSPLWVRTLSERFSGAPGEQRPDQVRTHARYPLLVLLALPFKRYPVALVLMVALMLCGWSLMFFIPKDKVVWASIGTHAYALMFVSMLSAMVWSSICRPDSQLLPRFRFWLLVVWAIYFGLLVFLPGLVAGLRGSHGVLVTGGLALIASLGIASGSGAKWAALVWMLPLLLGIWPEVRLAVWYALIDTATAPLALFAASGGILVAIWRRFMLIGDQAPTLSPADINASDLRYGPEAAQAANAGKLTRWFLERQQVASSRAFERILARLARHPQATAERALSIILMPNLHWRGIALEMLFTIVMVGIIGFLIGAQQGSRVLPEMVATYVGVLTALRFQTLHRATLMLRPSLTDAYLTLAPPSQLEFSAMVTRALRPALISALIFAGTMLTVILPLVPPASRLPLFAGGMSGAVAASLLGLGVVLMQLDAEKPRMLAGMIVLGFGGSVLGSICGAAFSKSIAGGAAVAVALVLFMLGFVATGEAYARRWPIRFDAPL